MTKTKPDRRTERTKQALMSAFVDLLLAEGYESITVERIVAKANIGRSTFYVHYKSKEEILRESLRRPSSGLAVIVGHDISVEVLAPLLEHFHGQRKLNRIFFAWPIRPIWVKCLAAMIEPRLTTVSRFARARPLLPLALIAQQIAESQIALIANWLLGKNACKAEAVAEALIAGTRAQLVALLNCGPDATLFIPGESLRVVRRS
jgi:AcrR family transcriptional regulator